MNWKENLIDSPSDLRDLILKTQRIAVLGIKTEAQADQPAFYVPKYLVTAGCDVIPVPVYYPEVIEILGKQVYRRLRIKSGARLVEQRDLRVLQQNLREPKTLTHTVGKGRYALVRDVRKSDLGKRRFDPLLALGRCKPVQTRRVAQVAGGA